jgi:ornithine carbamoyltransferase
MKDLTSLRTVDKGNIEGFLDLADELKKRYKRGIEYKPLLGKTVITSFPPTSLRTRVSFEAAIFQLGAQPLNMVIDFDGSEPPEDKIGYLNCWISHLVIRHPEQLLIERIAKEAEFSVINAMSRMYHPCEILSDLHALRELRGDLASLKFVFIGEGANICNTWFEAAAKLNLNLTQVCPKGYEVNNGLFNYAREQSKGEIKITNNLEEGIRHADIVLTDGWPVRDSDSEEYAKFLPYQLTLESIKAANKDCIVNPCPPFTRGNEITDEIIKSRYFIGYKAKESLVHMQKAILAALKR